MKFTGSPGCEMIRVGISNQHLIIFNFSCKNNVTIILTENKNICYKLDSKQTHDNLLDQV